MTFSRGRGFRPMRSSSTEEPAELRGALLLGGAVADALRR